MDDENIDIGKEELDLTEAELNKIFFGGEKKKIDPPKEESIQSKTLQAQEKHHPPRMQHRMERREGRGSLGFGTSFKPWHLPVG